MTTARTPAPRQLGFGPGSVSLDPVSGAPLQFLDPDAPQRRFLLSDAQEWHTAPHRWGSGHVVTTLGGGRWHTPATVSPTPAGVRVGFAPVAGVRLEVDRAVVGDAFVETHTFTNASGGPLRIEGLGVQTPFHDAYADAATSLASAVHAHLFTGGTWAWALAEPMAGTGRRLGLIVREGGLHAYSVESRNQNTFSNARGHLVLQVTDRARNPDAFGGQPAIHLDAGASYRLVWELAWYDDRESFLAATAAPGELSEVRAPLGTALTLLTEQEVEAPTLRVEPVPGGRRLTASEPGVHPIRLSGGGRTAVQFCPTLPEAVAARARYMLAHQRPVERGGLLAGALVPVDTRTGLHPDDDNWSDWSDGSERTCMPLLLQVGRRLGWLDASVDPALEAWTAFARAHLLDEAFTARRGSNHRGEPRLYDSPWLARFFLERHRATGDAEHLRVATAIIERVFALGVERFLAIGLAEVCQDLAARWDDLGEPARAASLRASILASADHFERAGTSLPAHEVNYEQSIAAPLVNLFITAYELTGEPRYAAAVDTTLPWLLSFGGPQPHARLRDVGIRHWDGYWFGLHRQWGDVFPHHWSALTANALARLPRDLRPADTDPDAVALGILRANLANVRVDGSATCAFVFPSAVDQMPAHREDPLANDQDWPLVLWMLLLDRLPEA